MNRGTRRLALDEVNAVIVHVQSVTGINNSVPCGGAQRADHIWIKALKKSQATSTEQPGATIYVRPSSSEIAGRPQQCQLSPMITIV